MDRFETEHIGPYTVEYDREDGTLRTSWPGDQIFLAAEEASELRDFLARVLPRSGPKIVTLCGSTRFADEFERVNLMETLAGNMVFSIGANVHDESLGITPGQKASLDRLHLAKIDASDEVFILNVGGYIGESTMREIAHAYDRGKHIRWLEEPDMHQIGNVMLQLSLAEYQSHLDEVNTMRAQGWKARQQAAGRTRAYQVESGPDYADTFTGDGALPAARGTFERFKAQGKPVKLTSGYIEDVSQEYVPTHLVEEYNPSPRPRMKSAYDGTMQEEE